MQQMIDETALILEPTEEEREKIDAVSKYLAELGAARYIVL
ncbi:hypothetical protein FACS1894216_18570 [Synergistales bacterium]|nr:hypothetical protein FACS1894216_18570 [Synergistales bacterium]